MGTVFEGIVEYFVEPDEFIPQGLWVNIAIISFGKDYEFSRAFDSLRTPERDWIRRYWKENWKGRANGFISIYAQDIAEADCNDFAVWATADELDNLLFKVEREDDSFAEFADGLVIAIIAFMKELEEAGYKKVRMLFSGNP
jgi:hypothetical protein